MEIQLTSFILGIGLVLVIAMAVVSVYAIVKVVKLKNQIDNNGAWTVMEFERIRKQISDNQDEAFRAIDESNKLIDSRCDKLYEKVMKNKNPRSEVFEMADKDGFKTSLFQLLNNEDEGKDLKNRILQLMNK